MSVPPSVKVTLAIVIGCHFLSRLHLGRSDGRREKCRDKRLSHSAKGNSTSCRWKMLQHKRYIASSRVFPIGIPFNPSIHSRRIASSSSSLSLDTRIHKNGTANCLRGSSTPLSLSSIVGQQQHSHILFKHACIALCSHKNTITCVPCNIKHFELMKWFLPVRKRKEMWSVRRSEWEITQIVVATWSAAAAAGFDERFGSDGSSAAGSFRLLNCGFSRVGRSSSRRTGGWINFFSVVVAAKTRVAVAAVASLVGTVVVHFDFDHRRQINGRLTTTTRHEITR